MGLKPDDMNRLIEAALFLADNADDYFAHTPYWGSDDGVPVCRVCGADWHFKDDAQHKTTQHTDDCPVKIIMESAALLRDK